MSNIIPFPKQPRARCPKCGWKVPAEVRADRESVKQALSGSELKVYIDCPECGTGLFWIVKFEL